VPYRAPKSNDPAVVLVDEVDAIEMSGRTGSLKPPASTTVDGSDNFAGTRDAHPVLASAKSTLVGVGNVRKNANGDLVIRDLDRCVLGTAPPSLQWRCLSLYDFTGHLCCSSPLAYHVTASYRTALLNDAVVESPVTEVAIRFAACVAQIRMCKYSPAPCSFKGIVHRGTISAIKD
jgi:hypothetical protein